MENFRTQGSQSPTFDQAASSKQEKRKGSIEGNSSIASEDVASVDSRGDPIVEQKGRDEEFEELLEKYNVDEIEEKPKHFYSPFCNRWISISGVRYSKFCLIRHPKPDPFRKLEKILIFYFLKCHNNYIWCSSKSQNSNFLKF